MIIRVITGSIPDDVAEFETPTEAKDYISTRRIAVFKAKDLKDETGELDETKVASHYVDYYARLQSIAVTFEAGLTLKTSHPYPISYSGTLYECIQGHTTQADWTPDITPALFSEIQPPTGSGYPEWVQKVAPPYYQIGDRVTHNEQNWESQVNDNVWEPGATGSESLWTEVI